MTDDATIKGARVLIVDDEQQSVIGIREILEPAGYKNIESITDSSNAIALFVKYKPDLVLVDLVMPKVDGFDFLGLMRDRLPAETYLPVLALAEPGTAPPVRRQAMVKGAKDLITKPPEPTELLAAVRNLLEIRFLTEMIGGGTERLDFLVDDVARQRTAVLEQMQSELLEKFASTADYRDPARGGHAERVARISEGLAIQLGFPREQAMLMGRASLLHNVGKVAVPEKIWGKPDKLTAEEFEQVKEHTKVGGLLLSDGNSPLLWLAEEIATTHHERWDGDGYLGLKGEAIPIGGRIVAVADSFDALTHERPYREAFTLEQALEQIKAESGKQFDPHVVEAFLAIREDLPR